jgi:uncharacterized protein (TIGR03437 family)
MPRAFLLVAALAGFTQCTGSGAPPDSLSYSAASIVNSASNQVGAFAPNTFLTIYGTNLGYTTRSISQTDIRANTLPGILPGTGVSVFINHVRASVYYVSPTQINVLIPSDSFPGPAQLQVLLDNLAGPVIPITLAATAPALFQMDTKNAIAVHADGSLLTTATPGNPGEFIVLYATGLGLSVPTPGYSEIPLSAASLRDLVKFRVLLDGIAVDPSRVAYAGVAPGFAGLYQINVKLPDDTGTNPEIRLQTPDSESPAGIHIYVKASATVN